MVGSWKDWKSCARVIWVVRIITNVVNNVWNIDKLKNRVKELFESQDYNKLAGRSEPSTMFPRHLTRREGSNMWAYVAPPKSVAPSKPSKCFISGRRGRNEVRLGASFSQLGVLHDGNRPRTPRPRDSEQNLDFRVHLKNSTSMPDLDATSTCRKQIFRDF